MKTLTKNINKAAATIQAEKYVYNRGDIVRAAHKLAKTITVGKYHQRYSIGMYHAWQEAKAAKALYLEQQTVMNITKEEVDFSRTVLKRTRKNKTVTADMTSIITVDEVLFARTILKDKQKDRQMIYKKKSLLNV